jgi:hypothetical protein
MREVDTRSGSGWRSGGLEGLVLAWALGNVVVTLGLLLGCGLGLGLRTSTSVVAVLAWASCLFELRARSDVPGVAAWASCLGLRRRTLAATLASARTAPRWPNRWTASGLASAGLAVALGLVVVYVAALADGRPLQVWDSWVTWGMKARLIWQTDTIPPGVYADPTRAVTLVDYPLLVPLLEAWLYTWLGAPDDRLAGLVNVVSYAALLGLACVALRARPSASLAAGAASDKQSAVGLLLPLLAAGYLASIWALAGLAGLAFADVPLALFALLAGVYLVRWLEGGPPALLVVAATAAGALGWTKREGVVLLALYVLASLIAGRGRGRGSRRWAAPALVLGGLLIAGPWLAWVTWRGLPDWQFVPLSLQTAWENRERLSFALGTLARWSLGSEWNVPSVWLLGLIALGLIAARAAQAPIGRRGDVAQSVQAWRHGRQLDVAEAAPAWRGVRAADLLPLVGLGYVLLMSGSYLFSAFVPYQTHVLASLGRLMAHVAPMVGVWLVMRWAEARPCVARVRRRAPVDAAPSNPPRSSTDRRRPALEGLGTTSGARLLPRPRPGTPPE